MPIVKIKRFSDATKVELTVDESIIEVGGGITYLNRSMIVASIKATQNYAFHEAQAIACKLFESGGKIYAKFNRASTGVYNLVDINFTVTELDNTCTVEHKTKVMPKNTNTITDTITTVDRTRAFIIHTVKSNEVASAIPMSNLLVTAEINANNQVTFTRGISSSAALTIEYQIVYIPDLKSVQVIKGTNTTNPTNTTISQVELERTAIFFSCLAPAGTNYVQAQDYPSAYLTSSTNLRVEAYNPSIAMPFVAQVCWFEFGRVINNNTTVNANVANGIASFGTTVKLDAIFEMMPAQFNTFAGAHSTTENAGHYLYAMKSLTTTQMTVERKDDYNAPASNVRTSVIEFDRGVTPRKMVYFIRLRKPMYIKQNTATTIQVGPYLDETNGKDEMNSLTLTASDFRISKNGATKINPTLSGSIVFDSSATYKLTFAAGDVDTLGRLQLTCHKTGCVYFFMDFHVVSAAVYDWMFGSTIPAVNVTQVSGSTQDIATQTLLTTTNNNVLTVDGVVDSIATIQGAAPSIDGATTVTGTLAKLAGTGFTTANNSNKKITDDIATSKTALDLANTNINTANANINIIDTNVDTILSKIPVIGNLATFQQADEIMTLLACVAKNNFKMNYPSAGHITFLAADGVTVKYVVKVNADGRELVV